MVTKKQPYQKPIYQKITKTKNTEGKALSRGPVNSPASSTRPTPTIQQPPTPSFHLTFSHFFCLYVSIFSLNCHCLLISEEVNLQVLAVYCCATVNEQSSEVSMFFD